MSNKDDVFNVFDPTGMFKTMRDGNMDSWSKMMVQVVNTDAYGQAVGTLLDTWLSSSAPFRKMMEKVMVQVLTNLQMPTRADVIGVAERLTNIETRLDDLEARLEENQRAAQKAIGPKTRPGTAENKS